MNEIDYTWHLNGILSNVREVHARVMNVEGQVFQAHQAIDLNREELREFRELFDEFVENQKRIASRQFAQTRVVSVKSDFDREFGHYGIVRRSTIGTLQALDVGIVSDMSIQSVSEELMIQTPRYWLAPALVAIAAWARNDEVLAHRAVQVAMSRDPRKTSLFFSLVLRRQGRLEASTMWLEQYLQQLDPVALSREFVIIFEASALGLFGPGALQTLQDQLKLWTEHLNLSEDDADYVVALWKHYFEVKRPIVDAQLFPTLVRVSPDWATFADGLSKAGLHGLLAEEWTRVRDSVATPHQNIESLADEILELLVTEFDEEELPMKREINYLNAVVDAGGDEDAARAQVELEELALHENSHLLHIQFLASTFPEKYGLSTASQRLAIGTSKDSMQRALTEYSLAYRSTYQDSLSIILGSDHSAYAREYGFSPEWRTRTNVDQNTAVSGLRNHWQLVMASFQDRVAFKWKSIVAPILITAGISVIFWFFNPWAALVGGGISAIVFGTSIYKRKRNADANLAEAIATTERAFEHSRDIYLDALAEFVDAKIAYEESDKKEREALNIIGSWNVGGSNGQPGGAR